MVIVGLEGLAAAAVPVCVCVYLCEPFHGGYMLVK